MGSANASPAGCPRARPNTPVWVLCQEHHNLVEASNQLVRQYDGVASRRNALVSEYEQVHAATNGLIDAYNWTW
jgi:hypothetical protein